MSAEWTVFSWGYEGWGNATGELLRAFDAVERARGFELPVFIDVRVRRQVRAVGFQDDAFERRAGRSHYRWLPGLGNAAVATGHGLMRLVAPGDAHELLGIVLAQRRQRRRGVFFCGCGSPFSAATCHRQLVRRAVLSAARSLGVALEVREWPGGELPPGVGAELEVDDKALRALLRGGQAVRLGREPPDAPLLGWPTGGVLRLRAPQGTGLVSVTAARFQAGEWRMPLWIPGVEEEGALNRLWSEARRRRKDGLLEAFPSG